MLWDGRQLRDIGEVDLRQVIESGLEEHLQLEYKSELYAAADRGRLEFLQDICMFANTAGGILLIGVSELRDGGGQPTGVPDPAGVIGLDLPNPATVLAAYDARVMEAIEERLPLESTSIDLAGGRRVLAFRVPNSASKPHSVRREGHIYFPARRERQRYAMNVREIKELVVRTANRLQCAYEIIDTAFSRIPENNLPDLLIGLVPIFSEDFLVNVRDTRVRQALANFSRTDRVEFREPTYTFDGLERLEDRFEVKLHRNGFLCARASTFNI
jgi:hypothetical protein